MSCLLSLLSFLYLQPLHPATRYTILSCLSCSLLHNNLQSCLSLSLSHTRYTISSLASLSLPRYTISNLFYPPNYTICNLVSFSPPHYPILYLSFHLSTSLYNLQYFVSTQLYNLVSLFTLLSDIVSLSPPCYIQSPILSLYLSAS